MNLGCDILVGTPGRILSLIEDRNIVLNICNYIVLDEADKMIDMNFEESVNIYIYLYSYCNFLFFIFIK